MAPSLFWNPCGPESLLKSLWPWVYFKILVAPSLFWSPCGLGSILKSLWPRVSLTKILVASSLFWTDYQILVAPSLFHNCEVSVRKNKLHPRSETPIWRFCENWFFWRGLRSLLIFLKTRPKISTNRYKVRPRFHDFTKIDFFWRGLRSLLIFEKTRPKISTDRYKVRPRFDDFAKIDFFGVGLGLFWFLKKRVRK